LGWAVTIPQQIRFGATKPGTDSEIRNRSVALSKRIRAHRLSSTQLEDGHANALLFHMGFEKDRTLPNLSTKER
jgi:hypothetical protein